MRYVLLVSILFLNCAFGATRQSMNVDQPAVKLPIADVIYVAQSTGGQTAIPFLRSAASDVEFSAALRQSIRSAGLFNETKDQPGTEWKLTTQIVRMEQKPFPFPSVEVEAEIRYVLSRQDVLVKEFYLLSDGRSTFADSIFFPARSRFAFERAARANIQSLIVKLGQFQSASNGVGPSHNNK
ncbi:MAG: hypothetical protein JNM27_21305 [Leptospirales bacterium]|nr:hypothetical protein [Leptospirales bacterium]